MGEVQKIAITAIRDIAQESFIAAALTRVGWKVVYRATSAERLSEIVSEFPQAILVASSDFALTSLQLNLRVLIIQGRERTIETSALPNPLTDYELELLLQGNEEDRPAISPTSSRLILVHSLFPRVGTSTIAINIADLISGKDVSTLLIDGNTQYPYLSRYFGIAHINRAVTASRFGFSLAEIDGSENLERISAESENFDCTVVDLGALDLSEVTFNGKRREDLISSWAYRSANEIYLLSPSDKYSLQRTSELVTRIRARNLPGEATVLVMTNKMIGRRDRALLIDEASGIMKCQVHLISRDLRSIDKAADASSTLVEAAPKSLLLGEIRTLLE